MFDDHRANDQSGIFGRATLRQGEALIITLCQCVPGNALAHLYPAVVFIQGGLEGPVKFREGELFVAVIADHRCTVFGEVGLFSVHDYTV